jgi:hypothetical protein
MSLVRLNAKSRTELETRVLAAALKQSFEKGDSVGAQLAHQQLSALLKNQKEQALASQPLRAEFDSDAIEAMSIAQLPELEILDAPLSLSEEAIEPAVDDHLVDQANQANVSPPTQPNQPIDTAQLGSVLNLAATTEAPTEPERNEFYSEADVIDGEPTVNATPSAKADATEAAATDSESTTGDHAPYAKQSVRLGTTGGDIETQTGDRQPLPEGTDFQIITSENTTIDGKDASQSMSGVVLKRQLTDNPPGLQYHALYRLLQVSQMSSYDEIHRSFLRLVRRQLRELAGAKRPRKQELLGQLRQIWIAHDILTDPITRTDYDFRDLGLRGENDALVSAPADGTSARPPSRIGELLQCAGLLEEAELDIACDMHKAMPEVQFGTFLVKQGFIGERDLESVLIGQKLLRAGTISVAQFQVAMELSQSRGLPIRDTLLERNYVSEQVLDQVVTASEKPSTVPPLAVAQLIDVAPTAAAAGLQAVPQTQNRADGDGLKEDVDHANSFSDTGQMDAQGLQISNAVPSWKDQLDWDAPETVATKSASTDLEHEREGLSHTPAAGSISSQQLPRMREINIANAAPSWKDQLDWEDVSPEEEEKEQEKVKEKVKEKEKEKDAPTELKESDFFSHMRGAQAIYDIDDNPLPPHLTNAAGASASGTLATGDHPSLGLKPDEDKSQENDSADPPKADHEDQT